jgi:hypothetical protein
VSHRYLDTLTTDGVRAAQERYGSRDAMDRLVRSWHTGGLLGPEEVAFLAGRDGFYLATVGETGWPYLQYRGGPPGFLHVLPPREGPDPRERHSVLAWADLRGNRQYLSVGNLARSPRVSLFLMDYSHRRRLKILGTAAVVDVRDDPPDGVAPVLEAARGQGTAERVVTVDVHGYDWNCPQHITPRWTEPELAGALRPVRDEISRLRTENDALRRQLRAERGHTDQDDHEQ